MPVTIEDVRRVAEPLPRSTEVLVRDRVTFRVGRVVWLAFSADETQLGFAFPREERDVLVTSEPAVFLLPRPSDLRFNWVEARLDALEPERMREIVVDAWRFVVPRTVALAPGSP
ncbi:MmcQ/YjbR family DNA-binding protein [Terrabacter aeriphilus]|uniref:MmcQ/YjbR family DNA-binding protein n=1 Tax=Terrabacter aeriphilus TaxID=515662 RepID=A0ABP9J146_9MICO